MTPTADCAFTAPTGIMAETNKVSWDAPPCDVDSYTLYFTTEAIVQCRNKTLQGNETNFSYDSEGLKEIQIAAHLNDMTNCSKGMFSLYFLLNTNNILSNLYILNTLCLLKNCPFCIAL